MTEKICISCNFTKELNKFPKGRNVCHKCKYVAESKESLIKKSAASAATHRNNRKNNINRDAYLFQDCSKTDKKKNLPNDLTREFVKKALDSKKCFYCEETDVMLTLDRIDNTLGHWQNNVNVACIRCNNIRGQMPYEAWIELVPEIKRISQSGVFGNWVGGRRKFKEIL